MNKAEILENTIREYYSSAEEELKKTRNNSAVVLYFKALVGLIDLYVLKNKGFSPSSHKQRFAITQNEFPDLYNLLDKDFPFYQDSYSKVMDKELAEVIREDVQTMAKKVEITL